MFYELIIKRVKQIPVILFNFNQKLRLKRLKVKEAKEDDAVKEGPP